MVAAFSFWKSTVLRGVPSFLGTTTIRAHQIVGVDEGTRSIIPKAISFSRSFFTASSQYSGVGMGV